MKKTKLFYFVMLFCMILTSTSVFALTAGDFQSQATGNWSAVGTWQTYDGTTWNAATALPDLTQAITVTIQAGHTVTVDAAYTANNAALNIVVNGYLKETAVITKTAGIWTINGTYEFNHASASGQGLPTATWSDGSTCNITGITTATTGINATQSFYNLTVNCPGWSGNLNMGWSTGTINIRGNVTVKNTGSGRWQWGAPASGVTVTVNVGGNLVIDGSTSSATALVSVTSNGTSTGTTYMIMNIQGNVIVTGNPTNNTWTNFSISRGSQGGSGTSTWNFYGDVSVSDTQIGNSTTTASGGLGKWVFAKNGVQALTLSNIYNTTLSPINIDVLSGSTLNIGSNNLSFSSGFFTLESGSGIMTSHASGLDGNLTNTGTKTLNAAANYTFNGSVAQVTGALLPAIVNSIVVNNAAGLALSGANTVNANLSLTTGELSLGANDITIGASGSISGASATNYIVTNGVGKVNIPAASAVSTLIPIGASASSYDPVTVTPTTASTFGAKVSGTLSGSANPGITYNPKEWTLTSTSASSTTLAFKPSAEDPAVTSMIANSPYYALIGQATGGGSYTNYNINYSSGTYSNTFSTFGSFVTGVNSNATAITNAAETSVNAYTTASKLIVDGALAGDVISVYRLNGQTVAKVAASSNQTVLNLNQGLYLVSVKSVDKIHNFKVAVK